METMETYTRTSWPGMKPQWHACPRSRANGLPLPPPARATPVNGGGHSGVRVPSGGVRDTGQPHAEPQALRDRALDDRKGVGSKVLSRCVLHIVTSPNRNQAPHKNAPTPRQQFARSGALLRFFEISAFLSILAGARRSPKRGREGHTDSKEIHALRGSKRGKGALGGSRSTRRAG